MFEQVNVMVQVAIVVRDVEKKAKAYAKFFGVEVPEWQMTGSFEESNTQFMGNDTQARAKLAFFNLENIQIELIEPVDRPSTWGAFLDEKGEGIHHIAFHVPNMEDEILRLEGMGLALEQTGDFTGGSYAYLNGQEKLGAIIELLADD